MAILKDTGNTNPLLSKFDSSDPRGLIPFDKIELEDFVPGLEQGLKKARESLEALKNNPEKPNFFNTFEVLETLSEEADLVAEIYFNLLSAEAEPEFHALAQEISPKLAKFANDVALDEKVFSKVQAAWTFCNQDSEKAKLSPEQYRVAEKSYKSFTRNGALLGLQPKAQLRKIDEELSKLAPKFSENVLKATYAWELELKKEEDFEGLPESASSAARALAKSKNSKALGIISLEAPSVIPFLTYSRRRDLREKLFRANSQKATQGEFDNSEILKRIAKLRHERAQLLGFSNHAEYVLAERMAEKPETVRNFLGSIEEVAIPAAQRELDQVKELALSSDGIKDFQPWDFAYYSEQLKKKLFDLDEESLRPYFSLDKVVGGLFEHAKRLYGLEFKLRGPTPVYHPDVKVYEVTDSETKKDIGLFYTDFHPRPTKRGGAWMTALREQGLWGGKVRRPHVAIVCNVTKPTESKPALLSLDEVRTLFHEFGHALHGLLSDCHYRSVAGTNVYWDFVELPSQIMENWLSEQESLNLFAAHYQTGEKLPAALAQKIKSSAKFLSGWQTVRQLSFAALDLAWHAADPSSVTSIEEFEKKNLGKFRLLPTPAGSLVSNAFGHIFAGGYSAGYYSYKWAEVLDADAFEAFKEKGLFDRATAQKFRNTILSRGGVKHPREMYREFRGRDADPKALLRRSGLISP